MRSSATPALSLETFTTQERTVIVCCWLSAQTPVAALYYANNSVNATGGADSALSVPKELIYLKIQQVKSGC